MTSTTHCGRRSPLDRTPTTYHEAEAFLGGRDHRKVGNNTSVLRTSAETVGLMLHRTVVVEWHSNGRARLRTGGWESVTTKDRLNRVLRAHGLSVYAKARRWHLSTPDGAVPFCDGMVVDLTTGTVALPEVAA